MIRFSSTDLLNSWLWITCKLCGLITFGGYWFLNQGFTSIHPFCKYFSEDKTCHSQERQERRAVYISKSQIIIRNCQKRKREPWHTVCFECVLMVESHGSTSGMTEECHGERWGERVHSLGLHFIFMKAWTALYENLSAHLLLFLTAFIAGDGSHHSMPHNTYCWVLYSSSKIKGSLHVLNHDLFPQKNHHQHMLHYTGLL